MGLRGLNVGLRDRFRGAPERLSATVRGRVQGVGFRAFTRREAERLGLRGHVRNESDGSVSVVAEGPRRRLEALLDALRRGPRHANVEEVAAEWGPADGLAEGFEIRR